MRFKGSESEPSVVNRGVLSARAQLGKGLASRRLKKTGRERPESDRRSPDAGKRCGRGRSSLHRRVEKRWSQRVICIVATVWRLGAGGEPPRTRRAWLQHRDQSRGNRVCPCDNRGDHRNRAASNRWPSLDAPAPRVPPGPAPPGPRPPPPVTRESAETAGIWGRIRRRPRTATRNPDAP